MKLQSDPTIVYGLVGGKGTLGRGIAKDEITRATPYNTYVVEGLPPGPIANPGRAALEAVANPARTKDLYFVADGTGGHAFAETTSSTCATSPGGVRSSGSAKRGSPGRRAWTVRSRPRRPKAGRRRSRPFRRRPCRGPRAQSARPRRRAAGARAASTPRKARPATLCSTAPSTSTRRRPSRPCDSPERIVRACGRAGRALWSAPFGQGVVFRPHGDREHDGLRPRVRRDRCLSVGLGAEDRQRPRP
jgi:hypothetical protein